MQAGTYDTATLERQDGMGGTHTTPLHLVSINVFATGMAAITHYRNGVKSPENKMTIFLPVNNIVCLVADGYAHQNKE